MTRQVTFMGTALTLEGSQVKVGDMVPNATLLNNELEEVCIADFAGKTQIISVVPSLDTPVCDMQTRRFNEEATAIGDDVVVLTISMDLPFAQTRWCGAAGIDRVITLSDHRDASFGLKWGVLIQELRLLTRAVFVVDANGVVQHVEVVPEITEHPDYQAVLDAVAKVS